MARPLGRDAGCAPMLGVRLRAPRRPRCTLPGQPGCRAPCLWAFSVVHDVSPASMSAPAACLAGGGEMGALMRSFDWSRTQLGPVAHWPQSLCTAVSIMLDSAFAMVI